MHACMSMAHFISCFESTHVASVQPEPAPVKPATHNNTVVRRTNLSKVTFKEAIDACTRDPSFSKAGY